MPTVPFQIQGGWSSDRPAEEIPPEFLTDLYNVIPKNKAMRRAFPFDVIGPTFGDPPRWLLPNQVRGDAYWLVAEDTQVEVSDLVTIQDITPAAGWSDHSNIAQPYSGGIINQRPVINSLLDGPYWWDQDFATPGLLTLLPGWPVGDLCSTMRPFREFLFALGVTTGGTIFPDLLRWSDAAPPGEVPQDWTAGIQSQAGEVSVSFNPGALIEGRQLIDRFYVYKTTSTYVMSLVGGTFVFSQRPVFSTVGCLARGCVIEWRGQHIVLTDGDLVIHDGLNVQSIAKERLRREIFDNMSGSYFDNSYLAYSDSLNAVLICRPKDAEQYPTEAIVLNLDDFTFGHQALISTGTPHATEGLIDSTGATEATWAQKTTTWANDPTKWNESDFSRVSDGVMIADYTDLELNQLGAGVTQGVVELITKAERVSLSLGEPTRRKFVRRVWPQFTAPTNNPIQITVGVQEFPSSAPAWGTPQLFVVGVDRFVNVNQSGNYLAYRIETTGGGEWELPSFGLEVEMQGQF